MDRSEQRASLGGIAPFGYRWHGGSLVVDETEASVRKLIYELFIKHKRKKTVAKILNDLGYTTRNKAPFSDTTIDLLLRDTTAKGIRLMGGVEIMVDPIVGNDLWERANTILDANSKTKMTKRAVQLFSGIAFCFCGGKMNVPSNLAKYVCPGCRHKIGTEDLEEIFISRLNDIDLGVDDLSRSPNTLFDYWPDFTKEEKCIVVEQITTRIVVGKNMIESSFAAARLVTLKRRHLSNRTKQATKPMSKKTADRPDIQNINEPLLSEAEAAKFLGISKMTLLRYRNA
jgi:hypothetical protein